MAKTLWLLLPLSLLVLCMPALADDRGPYLAVRGGLVLLDEAKFRDDLGTLHLDFDAGQGGAVAIGYDLGGKYPKLGQGRVELEGAYRKNDLDEADFAQGKVRAGGEMTAESIMFNAYGEYRDQVPWIPYAGLGFGYAVVEMKETTIDGAPFVDDEDEVFAYQFAIGTTYLFSPSWGLDMGYRLFGTAKPEFRRVDGSDTVRGEYLSHQFSLGLRVTF